MKHEIPDLPNSKRIELINEYIHNKKHRAALKLRLVEGMTYEEIAEQLDMSTQQIKTIIYRGIDKLIRHI